MHEQVSLDTAALPEADAYWRIRDGHLNVAEAVRVQAFRDHFKQDLPASVRTSQEYYHQLRRRDRGLPCYWLWQKTELHQAVRDRGLLDVEAEALLQRDVTKVDLRHLGDVIRLEYADTKPKFDIKYFTALPPELRIYIYELSMSAFPQQPLCAPTMPPLARLTKDLRAEVLPVYFERCAFEIRSTPAWIGYPTGSLHLAISPCTSHFFGNIAGEYAKKMRRSRVTMHGDDNIPPRLRSITQPPAAWWDITLPGAGGGAVSVVARKLDAPGAWESSFHVRLQPEVAVKELELALRPIVDPASGEFKMFGLKKASALRFAVERALPRRAPLG